VTVVLAVTGWPTPSASALEHPAIWTATCPGAQCPYSAPTAIEQGFADDVLARLNIERAQSARDYPYDGEVTTLPALSEDPALGQTAQAAAEYLASTETLQGYSGPFPGSDEATGENAGGPGFDSAGADEAFMGSPAHAGAILSAASDFAGIGVACDAQGHAWEVELFADANQTAANAGQARLAAELAANSVYAQSGGTITTVQEPPSAGGGTENAQDVFPTNPIAAGGPYATGVDWTCQGPSYPPGSAPVSPLPAPVTGMAPSLDGGGYALVDAAGAISIHGDAGFHGAANGLNLDQPIDHIVATPDGGGYWLVAQDGGVFAFGDAPFFGSMGGRALNAPVVALAPTPDGGGYWLVASDGGVFAFGDAPFFGSMGGRHLNKPIVGITANPTGSGYRLVASDGGIFAFGGAPFYGSTGAMTLNEPIVGMATTPDGGGYWLVASDGGVFAFGDAGFYGSTGALKLAKPIVAMAADPATGGYWLVGSDGGIFAFDAPFFGAD
jgi:uncharacterized protein YkwD